LAETIVFRLSPVLGSRSEVLRTPFLELLAHMIILNDQEEIQRYTNFMDAMYANLDDPKAKQEYIKTLQPDSMPLKTEGGGAGKTDFNQLEMIKKMQEENRPGRVK
jgi:hypothetical protein